MSFLITDTSVRYFNAKAIALKDSVPLGIYRLQGDQNGVYLSEYDYETSHGKIYGEVEQIADHIVENYTKFTKDKNLGVLLSGEKGLGKTLTIKLIIAKLRDKFPIIFINDYFGSEQTDFLLQLKSCVIIFDEFDKTHRGIANEESTEMTITKQETLLTVLDGTNSLSNNLYVLSCNKANLIDENLISRPSRIKYHYRFDSIGRQAIEAYCRDNLKKPELQEELVDSLLCNRFVSLDIVQTVVQELNDFDVSVEQVLKYINLDVGEMDLTFRFLVEYAGQTHLVEKDETSVRLTNYSFWVSHICPTVKEDSAKGYNTVELYVTANLKNLKIPLVGFVDITPRAVVSSNGFFKDKVKILKAEVRETTSFTNVGLTV